MAGAELMHVFCILSTNSDRHVIVVSSQTQRYFPERVALACFHHMLDHIPKDSLAKCCLRFAGKAQRDGCSVGVDANIQWELIKRNVWMDGVIPDPVFALEDEKSGGDKDGQVAVLVFEPRIKDGEDAAVAEAYRLQVCAFRDLFLFDAYSLLTLVCTFLFGQSCAEATERDCIVQYLMRNMHARITGILREIVVAKRGPGYPVGKPSSWDDVLADAGYLRVRSFLSDGEILA